MYMYVQDFIIPLFVGIYVNMYAKYIYNDFKFIPCTLVAEYMYKLILFSCFCLFVCSNILINQKNNRHRIFDNNRNICVVKVED